jgi:hypothetical protein
VSAHTADQILSTVSFGSIRAIFVPALTFSRHELKSGAASLSMPKTLKSHRSKGVLGEKMMHESGINRCYVKRRNEFLKKLLLAVSKKYDQQ